MNWTLYIHISPSNKYYVGITSQSPNGRWRNGKGYNNCTAFKNAIDKYGWDNIQHIVLRSNLNEHQAKLLEIKLIKKLKSNDKKYGYNITNGGDGSLGRSHNEETKLKISIANKGRSINKGELNGMYGKNPTTTRKVLCVTTGVEYESLKSASKIYNIGSGTLSKALKASGKCKGMEWRYV